MKKWYLSKTILVAMLMEALAQVMVHMEEVKSAISAHTNTDAGLAFAIAFPVVMVAMRFITTEPIKGVKKNVEEPNERNNRDNQNMDDSGDDDWDDDNGVVGLIPQIIGDPDSEGEEQSTPSGDSREGSADKRPKRPRRNQRYRSRKS